jgi:hypothetical protein
MRNAQALSKISMPHVEVKAWHGLLQDMILSQAQVNKMLLMNHPHTYSQLPSDWLVAKKAQGISTIFEYFERSN